MMILDSGLLFGPPSAPCIAYLREYDAFWGSLLWNSPYCTDVILHSTSAMRHRSL